MTRNEKSAIINFVQVSLLEKMVWIFHEKLEVRGMRYHHLRFDIWLCLLLSFLLGCGFGKIAESILPKRYQEYVKEHQVQEGEIGGVAKEDTPRAESVDDLLKYETFTIISKGIEYRNKGAGYYKGYYMYAVTLKSGEKVAARIKNDSVQHIGDSIYSGESILPLGRIVKENLEKEETFLHQIEYKEPLSRHDFYIDMVGKGEIVSEEDYVKTPVLMIQLATVFITFPIFHMIGAKIGIFPYFFAPKKKIEEEWK